MIDKDYRLKLELVRVSGISKLLLDKCDRSLLEEKVGNMLDCEIIDIKKSLQRLTKKQLIKLVEQTKEITNKDVECVYEVNRYGLKPGFTLFYISGKCKQVDIQFLKEMLDEKLLEIVYEEEELYKDISCRSVESVTKDTLEISFTYLSKYTFLDVDERPDFIYELKETFVWVNTKDMYIAIKSVPYKVISVLKKVFAELYNARVNSIRLTKKMVEDIFGGNHMRKGTFYKPNAKIDEPEKVTIADTNLADKPIVRDAYKGYDLTSSSLEEEVTDEITSTLGINCKQGKIYLTRNLNVTDFRAWSVRRIKDIINYMNEANLEKFEEFKIKNIMDDSIWNTLSIPQKGLIERVIYSLYCAKKHGLESYNIECDISALLSKCYKYFVAKLSFECEKCEEECIAFCSSCSCSNLSLLKDGTLICTECGERQNGKYILQCERGDMNTFLSIDRFVNLIPSYELIQKISEAMKRYLEIDFDYQKETFYIQDGNVILMTLIKGANIIETDEIKELKGIAEIKLELSERNDYLKKFEKIKEKCKNQSSDACGTCTYGSSECIMKLFTVLGFRPSPHQNSEFGDISLQVDYKGKRQTLVGIAKSKTKQDTLTLSSHPAREMIQQVITMSHDDRADIIAVICPMRFHPQLVAEISYLAKITNKKMIYMDDEFMIRLLKYYRTIEDKKKK